MDVIIGMSKRRLDRKSINFKLEDYQNLLEDLRIRINLINASVFLLEEKITSKDISVNNYIAKINKELEEIRKMMLPYPMQFQKIN